MVKWNIFLTSRFEKELKALNKKHRSIKEDLKDFMSALKENPYIGVDLGNGIRKIRMVISSKGKGKSGGARIITLTTCIDEKGDIYLLTIYDKSERATISKDEIEDILKRI
ncbi:MAG: type II toxin-antitoxin system RelE/ParE family toxin [Muribaculaceae bacterium]|nr:type II toxin-antitoxin system RelE/ParE family toxin [Muribaculaceae bacterium]